MGILPVSSLHCENSVITVHPSSLLRALDEAARRAGFKDFVRELKVAQTLR